LILNALTYPAILSGLLLNLLHGAREGVFSAVGLAIGLAVFWPFYRAGGMGMGDLKLFGAIGALKGASFVCGAMVDSALTGGAFALVVTVARGDLAATLKRAVRVPAAVVTAVLGGKPVLPAAVGKADTIPYGAAICAGTLGAWLLKWPW
jgi:prepilin peptidase CpaA